MHLDRARIRSYGPIRAGLHSAFLPRVSFGRRLNHLRLGRLVEHRARCLTRCATVTTTVASSANIWVQGLDGSVPRRTSSRQPERLEGHTRLGAGGPSALRR